MGRYLIVTPGYPSEEKKYNNGFVHARVKNYLKAGLDIDVFSYDKNPFAKRKNGVHYNWEGVQVERGNIGELREKLKKQKYDKILMHFAIQSAVKCVIKAAPQTPIIIWCHGVDVISWRRRLYNLRLKNAIKFAGYMVFNTLQRLYLHCVALKHKYRLTFVFVSNWLKDIAERDIWLKERLKNAFIIPNIVDENMFVYQQKKPADRLEILSIRSFASRNYANDQTVNAIRLLSKKPYFRELKFTICGDGRLWNHTVAPLRKYENVTLNRRFYSRDEIVQLHSKNGVMLMPSRQDTQGVSTCEGMSSGLVPVTSNNSAIPEYVPTSCGYLVNDYTGLVDAIEDMYKNLEKFLEFSKRASEYIRDKCSANVVIAKEIKLIESNKYHAFS